MERSAAGGTGRQLAEEFGADRHTGAFGGIMSLSERLEDSTIHFSDLGSVDFLVGHQDNQNLWQSQWRRSSEEGTL